MREFEDRLDRNASKIIANQNKGVETVVGHIAVFKSDQKIANRHVQSSVEELRQSARKAERSARKAESSQQVTDRKLDDIKSLMLRRLELEQEEKGEVYETEQKGVPRNVMASNVTAASSIHDISDCSQSQPRAGLVSINPPSMLEDDDDDTAPSAEIESMRKSHSANPNEAYLQQQNAELLQKLAAERQKNASVMAEKRQTEKHYQIFTSPTKRRHEDVNPSQSIQSASEQKAEMKYYDRRKSGLVEQMQGRNLLESERVQTSRPTTRSRTRLASKK